MPTRRPKSALGWSLRDATEDGRILAELRKQEDRGAAVIGAAMLEDCLTAAIRARFEPNLKIENAFFKGMGPLATFSAKIDLSLLMGLTNDQFHNWLHTIRHVRNQFAHDKRPTTFNSQRIKARCANLLSLERINVIADNFTRLDRNSEITEFTLIFLRALEPLDESPRGNYIRTILYIMFSLDILTYLIFLRKWKRPDQAYLSCAVFCFQRLHPTIYPRYRVCVSLEPGVVFRKRERPRLDHLRRDLNLAILRRVVAFAMRCGVFLLVASWYVNLRLPGVCVPGRQRARRSRSGLPDYPT